jgi:peptidoglycan/LPS O-acetylase OafA/YrhL
MQGQKAAIPFIEWLRAIAPTPYSRSLFFARDSVVFSWFAALAIFGAPMTLRPGQAPTVVRFLSNVSYSTYLLHIPVGALVIGLVITGVGGPTLAFATGTAAVLFASYLTYGIIELPGQRIGRAAIRATHNHLSLRPQAVPVGNPNGPLTRQQF